MTPDELAETERQIEQWQRQKDYARPGGRLWQDCVREINALSKLIDRNCQDVAEEANTL